MKIFNIATALVSVSSAIKLQQDDLPTMSSCMAQQMMLCPAPEGTDPFCADFCPTAAYEVPTMSSCMAQQMMLCPAPEGTDP